MFCCPVKTTLRRDGIWRCNPLVNDTIVNDVICFCSCQFECPVDSVTARDAVDTHVPNALGFLYEHFWDCVHHCILDRCNAVFLYGSFLGKQKHDKIQTSTTTREILWFTLREGSLTLLCTSRENVCPAAYWKWSERMLKCHQSDISKKIQVHLRKGEPEGDHVYHHRLRAHHDTLIDRVHRVRYRKKWKDVILWGRQGSWQLKRTAKNCQDKRQIAQEVWRKWQKRKRQKKGGTSPEHVTNLRRRVYVSQDVETNTLITSRTGTDRENVRRRWILPEDTTKTHSAKAHKRSSSSSNLSATVLNLSVSSSSSSSWYSRCNRPKPVHTKVVTHRHGEKTFDSVERTGSTSIKSTEDNRGEPRWHFSSMSLSDLIRRTMQRRVGDTNMTKRLVWEIATVSQKPQRRRSLTSSRKTFRTFESSSVFDVEEGDDERVEADGGPKATKSRHQPPGRGETDRPNPDPEHKRCEKNRQAKDREE